MARESRLGRKRLSVGGISGDALLIVWFVFALFPVLWTILLALKTNSQQTTTYFKFSPTLANFSTVLGSKGTAPTSVNFVHAIITSVISCGGAVIVSVILGVPVAYAAARFKFKGSNSIMFTILSFYFAPELMVVVPLFVIYNKIGLFDTDIGMIWVLQLVTLPFVTWIVQSYFAGVSPEIEQAALLDGYTRKRAFWKLALPLVRPGIAAAGLLAFVFAWNEYVFPLVLTDTKAQTMTVAVTKFLGGGGQAYYNLAAAAALLAAVPPLIVAFTMQRYLVRGLSFGAVKG